MVAHGQKIIALTDLHDSIKETSGLIYLNHKLITHNDSGGDPALYEIDSISGRILRTVFIENATNIDWEDICYDSTYVYIGDFGNDGSRTDLKIYRLPILSYFNTPNDTVSVDTINFSFSDQRDFTPNQFATNFDAEALIAYNESLYIFTKNWGDNWTNIYALPKTPGTYQISRLDSIDAGGLVTGATYNASSHTVLLTGYTFDSAFIIDISDLTENGFSSGIVRRYQISTPPDYSFQIEGIASLGINQYYLSAEELGSLKPALYRLDADVTSVLKLNEEHPVHFYPNPAADVVNVYLNDLSRIEIYDMHGILRKTATEKQICVSDLNKGMYLINIKTTSGKNAVFPILIIEGQGH